MSSSKNKKSLENDERLNRLKLWAEKTFGSVRQMSIETGGSATKFAFYFSAKKLPALRVLKQLKPFGLDVEWVMNGEEKMITESQPEKNIVKESTTYVVEPRSNELDAVIIEQVGALWNSMLHKTGSGVRWDDLPTDDRKNLAETILMMFTQLHVLKSKEKPHSQTNERTET